jgi:hypothetical protein
MRKISPFHQRAITQLLKHHGIIMPRRKKSAFERFFSFKQHRRRFGAAKIIAADGPDLECMRRTVVDTESQCYTHGSENDLQEHLNNLRKEFHGTTELEYYHAKLNVLLRRDFQTEETFRKFTELWDAEHDFLIEHLNTRWLISAADSFIDHHSDPLTRAYAFTAVTLVNTCKVYESERFACKTQTTPPDPQQIEALQNERIPLFDGTSALVIGTDDTLRNMYWRLDSLQENIPTSLILKELFRRVNTHETAFKRMKDQHTRKNTVWW